MPTITEGIRKNDGIKRPFLSIPDDLAPQDETCVIIPCPDDPQYKAMLSGVVEILNRWYNYERTGGDEGAQVARVWRDKIMRISWDAPCEGFIVSDFDVRQNEEMPCILEKTDDDGETWVPFANLQLCPPDIRNGEGGGIEIGTGGGTYTPIDRPPTPARTEVEDVRLCLSAANAANAIRAAYEEMIGRFDLAIDLSTIASGLGAAITALFVASIPINALLLIVTAVIGLIGLVVQHFSGSAFEDLVCILKENSGVLPDGTVSYDVDAILLELAGDGRIEMVFAWHLITVVGADALSWAGATNAITDWSCSACDDCGSAVFTCEVFPVPHIYFGEQMPFANANPRQFGWRSSGGRTAPGCIYSLQTPSTGRYVIDFVIDIGRACIVTYASIYHKTPNQANYKFYHTFQFFDAAGAYISEQNGGQQGGFAADTWYLLQGQPNGGQAVGCRFIRVYADFQNQLNVDDIGVTAA